MTSSLQWGGRFADAPQADLLHYGSSLTEDLVLAPFDVRCSLAHVRALQAGNIISSDTACALTAALARIEEEIAGGAFVEHARSSGAEDVHGAIDARVRALAPDAGELLHADRSRNDQVATTLLLYCADRALRLKTTVLSIAGDFIERAQNELPGGTALDAMTHWQPAQPVLLAFWLGAAAEPFVRDGRRFDRVAHDAMESCPLGSGAVAGSSLPLNRTAACELLGFAAPSRNAMDAIGNRDVALDLAHACVRAVASASRIASELIIWCTPSFGYARLGDGAATGSSLMPQKRNPDPFELVRGNATHVAGLLAGALAGTATIALSYHRDLQITKRSIIEICENTCATLQAFQLALSHVRFLPGGMAAGLGDSYTAATDVADDMIGNGMTAREAHAAVGAQILAHERAGGSLDWPSASETIVRKKTFGSTHPAAVERSLSQLRGAMAELSK